MVPREPSATSEQGENVYDWRDFLAPGAFGELLEPLGGQLSAFGAVDPLQFTGNGLALLPAAEREVNYGSNAQ